MNAYHSFHWLFHLFPYSGEPFSLSHSPLSFVDVLFVPESYNRRTTLPLWASCLSPMHFVGFKLRARAHTHNDLNSLTNFPQNVWREVASIPKSNVHWVWCGFELSLIASKSIVFCTYYRFIRIQLFSYSALTFQSQSRFLSLHAQASQTISRHYCPPFHQSQCLRNSLTDWFYLM